MAGKEWWNGNGEIHRPKHAILFNISIKVNDQSSSVFLLFLPSLSFEFSFFLYWKEHIGEEGVQQAENKGNLRSVRTGLLQV